MVTKLRRSAKSGLAVLRMLSHARGLSHVANEKKEEKDAIEQA